MQNTEIDKWTAPHWHPDFGDAENELKLLKEFSLRLIADDNRFEVKLDCLEEGYMKVNIQRSKHDYAEVHIIERDRQSLYGLFILNNNGEEEEMYFSNVHDGICELISKVTKVERG